MTPPASADGDEIRPFDLVELTVRRDPHEPGARGTVILIGACDVLVDFAWMNGYASRMSTHLALVPFEQLRIVSRRRLTDTGLEPRD